MAVVDALARVSTRRLANLGVELRGMRQALEVADYSVTHTGRHLEKFAGHVRGEVVQPLEVSAAEHLIGVGDAAMGAQGWLGPVLERLERSPLAKALEGVSLVRGEVKILSNISARINTLAGGHLHSAAARSEAARTIGASEVTWIRDQAAAAKTVHGQAIAAIDETISLVERALSGTS